MNIKNVVFDVGDVLVSFRYRDYMKDLGFREDVVDFLSENMVLTEFWHELDLGTRTEKEAPLYFTEKYPQYKDEIISFWKNIDDIVWEYDYAAPLIKSIKDRGYGVYILSNYPEELSKLHWKRFKFLGYTDGHIISAFEKITKPDAAIYRLLESRFGIELSESLFIDDRMVNIDGARAVGMQAILFEGYEELKNELVKLNIL